MTPRARGEGGWREDTFAGIHFTLSFRLDLRPHRPTAGTVGRWFTGCAAVVGGLGRQDGDKRRREQTTQSAMTTVPFGCHSFLLLSVRKSVLLLCTELFQRLSAGFHVFACSALFNAIESLIRVGVATVLWKPVPPLAAAAA